ncbi:MAG: M23 family metallopeptidase [Clostridia bacterium]|nr:M23 family metallopeptidase [Clostridia bacterium]
MIFRPKDKKESECINRTFWDSVENGDVSEAAARKVCSGQKYSPLAFIKSSFSKLDAGQKTAFKVAVAFVLASGVLIYIANGHRVTNAHKAIAGALLDQNQSMTRQLTDVHTELTDMSDKYEDSLDKIGEMAGIIENSDSTLSDLISENVDKNKIIEEQQLTIEEQQIIISNQQQTIEVQQTAIDDTDSLFAGIADIIGQDVNSKSGSSMYKALDKIERTKAVLADEIADAQKVKEYCDELEAKAAEIRDRLKRYPDYEPAPGLISYTYGNHNGKFHKGLDIFNKSAPSIRAAAYGKVVETCTVDTGAGLGKFVKIDHGNGYQTVYGHMSSVSVSVGQTVEKGQVIGVMGKTGAATGTHLHIEMYLNGSLIDPISFFDYDYL